ncbi:peptide synthetase [Sporosarcina sp. P13]|uniref:amino acid synthesis family protein n=1 Tax=Sporosarcina sp. P13 TaxID=2048263 RepID=UPI000C166BD4|nr:amino acid synthesis family protein [Sporosarcina sp. P13]PIC63235.1 peptide synthetase [Sporosarcina sp. P13]
MLKVRKLYTAIEEVFIEGEKNVDQPIRMIASLLVVKNPWLGRGFVQDLMPEINEYAPEIGKTLVDELFKYIESADDVEAFGKAAVVGVDGEIEHASAFIHTLKFGNVYRDRVKGESVLSFTNIRGGAGTTVTIPMIHKNEESTRSHYITFQAHIPDAPRADEIVIAIGASTGGRPHPRTGNRQLDAQEMGLV